MPDAGSCLPAPRRAACAAALLLSLAAPAGAQPACAPGSLASYVALGATGCRVAGMRVYDFAPHILSSSGPYDADPTQVRLAPRTDPGPGGMTWLGFLVTAPFGPLSVVDAGAAHTVSTRLRFSMDGTTVTGVRALLVGAEVSGTGDLAGQVATAANLLGSSTLPTSIDQFYRHRGGVGGRVGESTMACVGGTLAGLLWFPPGGCAAGPEAALFADVPALGRGFEMEGLSHVGMSASDGPRPATGSATANLDGFVGQFLVSDAQVTSAPEPGTLALLGGGLLTLAGAARRRRRG